jgi:hypothetical protein
MADSRLVFSPSLKPPSLLKSGKFEIGLLSPLPLPTSFSPAVFVSASFVRRSTSSFGLTTVSPSFFSSPASGFFSSALIGDSGSSVAVGSGCCSGLDEVAAGGGRCLVRVEETVTVGADLV